MILSLSEIAGVEPSTEELLRAAARRHAVDENLVISVARRESAGEQEARSPKGAIGVMQLMPGTAKDLGVDPNDEAQNIEGGARYLRELLDRYGGDRQKALAAYNLGLGRLDAGETLPKETQEYVAALAPKAFEQGTPGDIAEVEDAATVPVNGRTLSAPAGAAPGSGRASLSEIVGIESVPAEVRPRLTMPGSTGPIVERRPWTPPPPVPGAAPERVIAASIGPVSEPRPTQAQIIERTWNDPEFHALGLEERRGRMAALDADFARLPLADQNRTLAEKFRPVGMKSPPAEIKGIEEKERPVNVLPKPSTKGIPISVGRPVQKAGKWTVEPYKLSDLLPRETPHQKAYLDLVDEALESGKKGKIGPALQLLFTSPIDLEELDEALSTFLVGPFGALERGAIEAVAGMATAPGTALVGGGIAAVGKAAAAAVSPVIRAGWEAADLALSAYFSGTMAGALAESGLEAWGAVGRGDWEGAAKALGFGSVEGFFAYLGARHAVNSGIGIKRGIEEGVYLGRMKRALQEELNNRERLRREAERKVRPRRLPAGEAEGAVTALPPPEVPLEAPTPAAERTILPVPVAPEVAPEPRGPTRPPTRVGPVPVRKVPEVPPSPSAETAPPLAPAPTMPTAQPQPSVVALERAGEAPTSPEPPVSLQTALAAPETTVPRLQKDAREVLTYSAENDLPHVTPEPVRGKRYDAAVRELQAVGLVDENGVLLTSTGLAESRRLFAERTRRREGAPISEYKAGKGKIPVPRTEPTQHTEGSHGFLPVTLQGRPGYTDGSFMMVGEAPGPLDTASRQYERLKEAGASADRMLPKKTEPIVAVAYTEADPAKRYSADAIWFTNGVRIGSPYYDHILSRYPGAQFEQGKPEGPIVVRDTGGVPVGMVMPLRTDATPSGVQAIIDSAQPAPGAAQPRTPGARTPGPRLPQALAGAEQPPVGGHPTRRVPGVIASRRDFYTPGNVVFKSYWGKYDKVLDYQEKPDGTWLVQVQHVDAEGNVEPGAKPRWHATPPGEGDRVVSRVPGPLPSAIGPEGAPAVKGPLGPAESTPPVAGPPQVPAGGHPARRARRPAQAEAAAGQPAATGARPVLARSAQAQTTDLPPIGRVDILREISRRLRDLPIRTGHFVQRAHGIYKVRAEVVRTKEAQDLAVAFHEIGHHINKLLWGTARGPAGLNWRPLRPFRYELAPIATKPRAGGSKLPEGFAEFVRLYVTDPAHAQSVAPNFFRWFEDVLGNEPELKEALLAAREDVQRYLDQSAKARVLSQVRFGDEPQKLDVWEKAYDAYTAALDRWYRIGQVVNEITKGQDLAADQNPYKQAQLLSGSPAKAEYFLWNATFDPVTLQDTGESLNAVMQTAPENLKDGVAYLVAERVIEKEGQGIRTGIDLADAQEVVAHDRTPELVDHATRLRAYENRLLDYLGGTRLVSAEQVHKWREKNLAHVPFYRVMEEIGPHEPPSEGGPGRGGGGVAGVSPPVKAMRGSERRIVDPYESVVKNTHVFINRADRNAVLLALVDMASRAEGAGKWIEKLPRPVEPTTFQIEQIRKALEDAGVELPEGEVTDLATVFSPTWAAPATGNIVTVIRDGKPEFYRVLSPSLHETLLAADESIGKLTAALLRVFGAPARLLRAGATGFNPEFMLLRNPFRDQLTAWFQSRYGYRPDVDLWHGIFSIVNRDEFYKDWVKAGGMHAALVSLDSRELRRSVEALIKGGPHYSVRHPIELLRLIGELTEGATRVGEFRRGRQAGASEREAAWASREVSVDFQRRGGAVMKAVNMLSAYYNAGLQGTEKFLRTHGIGPKGAQKGDPLRTIMKGLPLFTASLLLYLVNRDDPDWQETPRYLRDNAWLVPTKYFPIIGPKLATSRWTKFVPIPKPFLYGFLYSTVPERIFEYIDNRDPKAFDELAGNLFTIALPGTLGLPMPTVLMPLAEWWADKNWFTGKPTVPQAMKGLPAEYQAMPYTSEFSKLTARGLARAGVHVSPAKLDNAWFGVTGGLGRALLHLPDRPIRWLTGTVTPETKMVDMPLLRALAVRTPSLQGPSVQRLYDRAEHLNGKFDAWRAGLREPGGPAGRATALTPEELSERAQLNAAARALTAYGRLIRHTQVDKSLTPEAMRQRLDAYMEEMVRIARRATDARSGRQPGRHPAARAAGAGR